jgi:hypothetical protein
MTAYNTETGQVDEVGDFQDNKPGVQKAAPKKAKTPSSVEETDKASRHEKWKADQAAKKEATDNAKYNSKAKKQALALEHMRAGNFHAAADALGTTVPELLALTQNAALSIPTEQKKLTAEEQRIKDYDDYRASVDKKLAAAEQFKYETVATNWARENISPVMADEEKYPLLNKNKDNVAKLQRGVYEFLNKHYNDTCEFDAKGNVVKEGEILSVADILDTLEAQTEAATRETLEGLKGVKKFAEYFNDAPSPKKMAKQVAAMQQEEADIEQPEEQPEEEDNTATFSPKSQTFAGSNQQVPFALLSATDKLKYIANERKKGKF